VIYQMSFGKKGDCYERIYSIKGREQKSWENKKTCLREIVQRLKDSYTQLHCCDGIKLIRKADHANAVFYVDPPYPTTSHGKGWDTFTQEAWEDLVATLEGIRGHYVLSGHENEREPSNAQRIEVERALCCSSSHTRKQNRTEVLWVKRDH
jgi:site-specific DNA-adenine methylase